MLEATKNDKVIIIDELDANIHPMLLQEIINYFYKKIKGQIIYAGNNSITLLNIRDLKDGIYVINNSQIKNINDFRRIYEKNNIHDLYCRGVFGGIPVTNISKIKEVLENVDKQYC